MRYQLRPFYVEAFQWHPGTLHPRIYAKVSPHYAADTAMRISPIGAIPYPGVGDAFVLETLGGSVRQLEDGDWVLISEDTQMLCVIDDEAMERHYMPATALPDHVRTRSVEI